MRFIVAVVAVVGWVLADSGSVVAEDQALRLAVDLTDGSRVIGTSKNESIRVQTSFGNAQVSLRLVEIVRWQADREHVIVEFANGDRLTGAIIPEPLQLTTLFGDAKVGMEHVVSIKRLPADLARIPALEGLILYLPFDEEPKKGVVSSRVGELQGNLKGGQWVRQGHRGGSMQFNSADDCILFADDKSLRPEKLTVSAWVNPDKVMNYSTWRGIVAKTSSGSWTGGYGLARYPSDPDAHFFVNYYSTDTAHAPIPDNEWTHIAATYDDHMLTLYLNGLKVVAVTPNASYNGPIRHSEAPLLIGKGPDGYGWFGKIDEVMLFNRALSADEIGMVYRITKD